uniref:Trichohyalin-plectin-homology domain-containing protein n=1 Tax=Mesocestoides corti TaxID=53468 RepID=A0A5K3FZ84_MESCO
MESRGAKEARLVAKREARERATSERQRIEAVHRECSESLRRDEKERVMRMRRVDSIMSRCNHRRSLPYPQCG